MLRKTTVQPSEAAGVRKGVGKAFYDEEQRFRVLVEGLSDYAIFMLEPDGTIATWNGGAERFKGYRAAEIIGRHFSCFYAPEAVEAHTPERELAMAAENGRFEDEGWRVRKDGTQFWASMVITALRDSSGRLLGFGNVTRDITERRKANEQFRLAIEAAPIGMLMMDRLGTIVLVNAQIERLFGYTRAELLGKPIEMLVPARFRAHHPQFRAHFFGDPKTRPMGAGRDLFGLRKDGSEVPVEIGLNPLETAEGQVVLSSVVDITERKRSEQAREREQLLGQLQSMNAELEERVRARTAELSTMLREREVLLQEVHHRVKNNLQVISSMINMQVRQMKDAASREALRECQTRVQAIALIHEKLYQSKDYSRIPFSEYVRSLASNVFQATGMSAAAVALELSIGDVSLAVDQAIPCGLILNELITNSLKHAFPDSRPGHLSVELKQLDGAEISLAVSDDGVGLTKSFDIERSSSLGMQLVSTLTKQLDGQLEIVPQPGATFRVTFPLTQ